MPKFPQNPLEGDITTIGDRQYKFAPEGQWEPIFGTVEAKGILGRELTPDEIGGIERGTITREFLLGRKEELPLTPTGEPTDIGADIDGARAGVTPTTDVNDVIGDLVDKGAIPQGFASSTDFSADILQNLVSAGFIDVPTEEAKIESRYERRIGALSDVLAGRRQRISEKFAPALAQARMELPQRVGAAIATVARLGAGLGADTVNAAFVQQTRQDAQDRIERLKEQRRIAMDEADLQVADRILELTLKEEEELDKLNKEAWKRKVDIVGLAFSWQQQQRMLAQTDMDFASKIPEGETWTSPSTGMTWIGIKKDDPFFTSAQMVSLMKEIPLGSTEPITITNPATGEEETYNITGIAPINKDVDVKTFSNNRTGVVTFVKYNKETGIPEVTGQIQGAVGIIPTKPTDDGLKIKIADVLSRDQITKLKLAGIPEGIAKDIAIEVAGGTDLEVIREALRVSAQELFNAGVISSPNPSEAARLLDKFDEIAPLKNLIEGELRGGDDFFKNL